MNPYPDIIRARADLAATRLLRVLVPIYREHPPGVPDLLGSGVLVRAGHFVFLLSAAHVADLIKSGPHYFGVGDSMVPLPQLRFTTKQAEGSMNGDQVDLAYWVLDPIQAARTKSLHSLEPGDIDRDVRPFSSDFFLLYGYPCSRQSGQLDGNDLSAITYSFLTEECTREEYAAATVLARQNLLIDFNKKDAWRGESRVTAPNLYGVSGGGAWRLPGLGDPVPGEPKLSAIAIEWRRGRVKAVLATRIGVWIAAVASNLPGVGPAFGLPNAMPRSRIAI